MAGFTPPQFASNPYMTGGVNPYLQMLYASGIGTPQEAQQAAPQAGPLAGPLGQAAKLGAMKGLAGLGGAASGGGALTAPTIVSANLVPGAAPAAAAPGAGLAALGTAAPIAGIAGGAYAAKEAFDAAKEGDKKGAFGWGSLAGGIGTGGLLGLAGASFLGDKDMWKTEGDRWKELGDEFNIGGFGADAMGLKSGRSKAELMNSNYASDFRGEIPGGWVNNKFAGSRDLDDAVGKDIWGYATFVENLGQDWINTSAENREAIAQKALDLKLVNEHDGTVDVKWNDDLTSYAQKLLGQSTGDSATAGVTTTTPTTTGVPKPTFTKEDIERKVEEAKKFAEQQKKKVEDQYGFLFK